ncbi:monovalent cation:proton antiporter-2 (CPA2) family protein [Pararhizobium sp. IMCC21322]|uniref:monovalent cation:proton antiporter-2 (CPA2) family protein n=1 Tax=Pararhizobium sp. IMCC21322 TaxID=3067903 RepID=UPI00274158A8|nr:monovalent cation:proton antiporter-2 (CPA2) family protein [Pararhizobium sp. IMCC21322]
MASLPGSESLFTEPLILLGAAALAVPICKRLGFGSILGYLAAGVVIGPLLRLITESESILKVAELGVVLLLFVIGLELKPSRLWSMRRDIFGLGSAQLLVTGAALTAIVYLFGLSWQVSVVVGMGMALSSTAIGIQTLNERGELSTPYGQKSFSILLLQDLAIVPLLAMVAALAPRTGGDSEPVGLSTAFLELGLIAGSVVLLVVIGRYLLNPMFRILANSKAHEIMTVAALLVVFGAAALLEFAGMSSAMGAFLAGVMLADSSFRHELEANIEPFRGLLMGLFFMAVGMTLDLAIISENWALIAITALLFISLKAAILYGLGRLFRLGHAVAVRTALLLPQHGEFAFVLFTAAVAAGLMNTTNASILTAVATITMALSPLAMSLAPKLIPAVPGEEIEEDFSEVTGNVILISFGRFGQVVSQLLLAERIDVTIIDNNAERIRSAAKFGFKIYYGDGRRLDVLRAAGLERARMVIVCTDGAAQTSQVVRMVQKNAPQAKVYARSNDRSHSIALRQADVDYEIRESVESAMRMGNEALKGLGVPPERIEEITDDVRKRDELRLQMQADGDPDAARHTLHINTVKPEPLLAPVRSATPLTKETGELVDEKEGAQSDELSDTKPHV